MTSTSGNQASNDESKQPAGHLVVLTWTLVAGLLATIVFVGFPRIDLWIAGLFSFGEDHFILFNSVPTTVARAFFTSIYAAALAGSVYGLVAVVFTRKRPFGLAFPVWLFLAVSLIVGPGVVTNIVFKDHWGRARPYNVSEFGGPLKFTPALEISDQCHRNCSFVSGEAAAIYTVGFAFAFAFAGLRRRRTLIGLGIAGGSLAGLVRMMEGRHFVSDIVFAGVFMMFVVVAIHWLIMRGFPGTFAEEGPIHRFLIGHAERAKELARRLVRRIAAALRRLRR